MHYHSKLKKGDGKYHYFFNGGLDWYKKTLLIPLFNGQIIVLKLEGKEVIVNMRSILEVELYKTKELLEPVGDRSIIQLMNEKSFDKFNCTKEILNEVKQELVTNESKSLIQKSFMKIEDQIFVIMKFGDEQLDSAYDGVIVPLAEEFNLKAIRVDKIEDSGKISDQILENIAKSKIIISDLTGERPNCYYETGFAHAIGKEIILTIKENEKLHFDLAGHRFIVWKTEADLRKKLKERLKSILSDN